MPYTFTFPGMKKNKNKRNNITDLYTNSIDILLKVQMEIKGDILTIALENGVFRFE